MADVYSVPVDMRELSVVPLFKYRTYEDVKASERAGYAVMKTEEMVEVRMAGQKLYSPEFRVTDQWKFENGRVVTYAERWAKEYAQFVSGGQQLAAGTPLEMLRPFGMTDALLSLCRALKIYSVEALAQLEGQAIKNLGMHANGMQEMARKFLENKESAASDKARIAELEAQIAALRNVVPEVEPAPEEADHALAAADEEKARLKERLAELTGSKPRGNPSVETLKSMIQEAGG